MRLPSSVSEISPEWLTEALAAGGVLQGVRVEGVSAQIIGEGAGFAGELARLTIRYGTHEADLPRTMIAKVPTQGEGRALFLAGGIYLAESLFYRELASLVPIRVPRCYFNGSDLTAGDFVLLMEDLAPARVGDQLASCSRAEAEVAVRALAGLHARFWDGNLLQESVWLDQLARSRRDIIQFYPFMWAGARARVGDLLSAKVTSIASSLQMHFVVASEALVRPPVTLTHGDYRLDNMLFDLPGPGDGFAVIDWQAASAARGAADLAYFLTGSLRPEDRRAWGDDLVSIYLEGLAQDGVERYGARECREDMALGLLTQLATTVLLMSGADLSAEGRGPDLARAVLERTNAIFDDTDFGFFLGP